MMKREVRHRRRRFLLVGTLVGVSLLFSASAFAQDGITDGTEPTPDGTEPPPVVEPPPTCDGRTVAYHIERAKAILDRGYRHSIWWDRRIITRRQVRRWQAHRECLKLRADRLRITNYRDRVKASRDAWRRRRAREFRNRYTPYDCGRHGYFAIPCDIVRCESRFDFRARNPWSTAGGAYQIIDSTWYRNGGAYYDSRYPAARASEREQHIVGRRVWEREGRGSWEC